jgi:hypothetical protein
MPVARKGQKQDKRSDVQDAAGFKFMNVEFSRTLIRRWADGTHQSIVAPVPMVPPRNVWGRVFDPPMPRQRHGGDASS